MPSAARRCIARVHNELLVEPAKPYEKAAAFSRGVRLKTTVLTTVLTGRPADSIAGYAPTERFDLIVMGTTDAPACPMRFLAALQSALSETYRAP